MNFRETNFALFLAKKFLSRLGKLAKFDKYNTSDNRGKYIFGRSASLFFKFIELFKNKSNYNIFTLNLFKN